jgi:hypothetical protein
MTKVIGGRYSAWIGVFSVRGFSSHWHGLGSMIRPGAIFSGLGGYDMH